MESHERNDDNQSCDDPHSSMDYHGRHDWSAAPYQRSRHCYPTGVNANPRYGCEPSNTSHGSFEVSKS
ncbi:hypothetical protein PV325_012119 [Microctonus aethiopoides]|nr:hypothetical protein PV325_012119 [Microctonus aethiopoides]